MVESIEPFCDVIGDHGSGPVNGAAAGGFVAAGERKGCWATRRVAAWDLAVASFAVWECGQTGTAFGECRADAWRCLQAVLLLPPSLSSSWRWSFGRIAAAGVFEYYSLIVFARPGCCSPRRQ